MRSSIVLDRKSIALLYTRGCVVSCMMGLSVDPMRLLSKNPSPQHEAQKQPQSARFRSPRRPSLQQPAWPRHLSRSVVDTVLANPIVESACMADVKQSQPVQSATGITLLTYAWYIASCLCPFRSRRLICHTSQR